MKYFFFDARSKKLHDPTYEVGIIITDATGVVIENHYFEGLALTQKFAIVFNKWEGACMLVSDKVFPMKSNLLNTLIDEGYIKNTQYFILDMTSVLFGRGIYNTIAIAIPDKNIMKEIEKMIEWFFSTNWITDDCNVTRTRYKGHDIMVYGDSDGKWVYSIEDELYGTLDNREEAMGASLAEVDFKLRGYPTDD